MSGRDLLKGKSTKLTHIKVSLFIVGNTNQPVEQFAGALETNKQKSPGDVT